MAQTKTITDLDISFNDIGDEGARAIARSLGPLTELFQRENPPGVRVYKYQNLFKGLSPEDTLEGTRRMASTIKSQSESPAKPAPESQLTGSMAQSSGATLFVDSRKKRSTSSAKQPGADQQDNSDAASTASSKSEKAKAWIGNKLKGLASKLNPKRLLTPRVSVEEETKEVQTPDDKGETSETNKANTPAAEEKQEVEGSSAAQPKASKGLSLFKKLGKKVVEEQKGGDEGVKPVKGMWTGKAKAWI